MHDPVYRMAIAWQNVAYNQPPHTSYFLGHDMSPPPRHGAPAPTTRPRRF
jgi:rhamnogalacturonan endolyase